VVRKKQVRGAKNKLLRIVFSYMIIVCQHATEHPNRVFPLSISISSNPAK